ncbi:sigma-54 dependent transcriptional regulator [Desulfococcaceae bacterium HSG8]|nr:sigma-54 dependent transcriptional regulator [Desulfococcaceae bacterium HSG8]
MDNLKILIVDDDQGIRDELGEFLVNNNYAVFQAGLPSEAFKIADEHEPDIVILDIRLPETNGQEILARIKKSFPDTEVIMITGHGNMDSAIQSMRSGASDYLTKPFRLPDIQRAIERTRKFIRLNRKLKKIELNYSLISKALHDHTGFRIIGNSPAIESVVNLMVEVARAYDTPVLITGESGTGKELAARGIHYLSNRKDYMFCAVNASAITTSLFESEFFGYKKGSFAGAAENKLGWFEAAHKGTLFLDEICSMRLIQQAKLLRVVENKAIFRVGSYEEVPVDVRIISATNKDMGKLVSENRFRKDLYYRLNTFVIHIPPLRERKQDIPLLLKDFTEHYATKLNKPIRTVGADVVKALMPYSFPGNIRELKNMVERAVILCNGKSLRHRHFSILQKQKFPRNQPVVESLLPDLEKNLEFTEKTLIMKALEKADYNKSKAAGLLRISRQSLHRRLNRLGLKV